MQQMVADGEVNALVPERVWQELARGLMEARPSRMLTVLKGSGALHQLLPEVDTSDHLLAVLDTAAQLNAPLTVRFGCLCHAMEIGEVRGVCERWRVPVDCRELADVVAREHATIHGSSTLSPAAVVRLLERCDAFRKPARFAEVLLACEYIARGRSDLQDAHFPQRPQLLAALAAAQAVPTQPIAQAAQADGRKGPQIGELIHAARVEAVAQSSA
jgi:tRNA nucleotidyltransferase (CCA-adding enzyme)